MAKVAFIGLGNMGGPMAINLVKAGHQVQAFDLSAAALAQVESLEHMAQLLGELERDIPYPGDDAEGPRGRLGSVKSCALPENWLQSRELSSSHRLQLQEAELSVSGG